MLVKEGFSTTAKVDTTRWEAVDGLVNYNQSGRRCKITAEISSELASNHFKAISFFAVIVFTTPWSFTGLTKQI